MGRQAERGPARDTAGAAPDPRWTSLARRDRGADGSFVYSVATTGVYCRPSCPSRLARPRHVRFHDTPAAARGAGFRPCRRCNPDGLSVAEQNAAIIASACRSIDDAKTMPSLSALAAAAELSPAYFHRMFRRIAGLTPRAYAAARQAERTRQALDRAGSVTTALHDAGFGSSGRFYSRSTAMLGMRPQDYRSGGRGETIRFAVAVCSLGAILVASSGRGVACILIGDRPETLLHTLQDRFHAAEIVGGDLAYERHVAQVIGLVEAPRLGLELPLDLRGTAFQQRVWQALREIPAGSTATYTEVAARIGAPGAARAVAGACAANPLAVAIPCHRVVRQDGSLSGYRWGVARKRALLEREAAPSSNATTSPATSSVPAKPATPGQPAPLQNQPPAEPITLDPA